MEDSEPTPVSPLPAIEPTPVKEGWKTSEFGVVLLFVVPMLLSFFGVDVDQANTEQLVGAGISIFGGAAVIWRFIKSRENVKTAAIKATAATAQAQAVAATAANMQPEGEL